MPPPRKIRITVGLEQRDYENLAAVAEQEDRSHPLAHGLEQVRHAAAAREGIGRLRGLDRPVTALDLADELRDDALFLEIFRLLLGAAAPSPGSGGPRPRGRGGAVLEEPGIPFERGITFLGKRRPTAKCDFAIPAREHPKVVIEAKGFEATGSRKSTFRRPRPSPLATTGGGPAGAGAQAQRGLRRRRGLGGGDRLRAQAR